jgi:hypothetical protein
LFHKTYRHLYEDEKRNEARQLEPMVLAALDKDGTSDGEEDPERVNQADSEDGRYWARTSALRGHSRSRALATGGDH